MKIVIEIDEEDWKDINDIHFIREDLKFKIGKAIMKGKPLPKNHGRLIDEQQIIDRFKPIEKFEHWRIGLDGLFNVLSDAPTIIEGSDTE